MDDNTYGIRKIGPQRYREDPGRYFEDFQVAYIFIANLAASLVSLLLLIPFYFNINYKANFALLKKMLFYGFPILISGLAFTIN